MQADPEKAALIEDIMFQAAEQLGDITELAMKRYYARFPDAVELFERLSIGERLQLEGRMVENTVFCIMRWFESPFEVKVLLSESLQHHEETLEVIAQWYIELIDVVADIIRETIPETNTRQHAVFQEVLEALHQVTRDAAALSQRKFAVKRA